MDIFDKIKKEGLRRNYSPRTIKAYIFWIEKFLKYSRKDHRTVRKSDARNYLDYLIERKKSYSSVNLAHSAIKFMLEVMGKRWNFGFKFGKRQKKLPEYLTKSELMRLIGSISNRKHKLAITLCYASGVRVNELVCIRVRDLNLEDGSLIVRAGKGNKDRITVTSNKLISELQKWIEDNNLSYDSYLFPGRKEYHLSARTIQVVVKQAAKNEGIQKNVHPHSLRHSFATHFTENEGDMFVLQSLMGHKDKATTEGYLHIVMPKINATSPYDEL